MAGEGYYSFQNQSEQGKSQQTANSPSKILVFTFHGYRLGPSEFTTAMAYKRNARNRFI